MDLEGIKFKVTVGNLGRFEERAEVDVFAAFATAVQKSLELHGTQTNEEAIATIAIEAMKPIFRRTRHLAAFIYECGFKEDLAMKNVGPFDDWLEDIDFQGLMGYYDEALNALFLSSPLQTTTPPKKQTKKASGKKNERAA